MEINKKIVNFSYRIEPKPGGGFVAHTSDPTMETVEAATKEELEQMMQDRMKAMFGSLGGLDLKKLLGSANAGTDTASDFSYHIEAHPEGFRAHPSDPKLGTILEGASREEFAQKIRETLGPEAAEKVVKLLSRLDDDKLGKLALKLGDMKIIGNVSVTTTKTSGIFSKAPLNQVFHQSSQSELPQPGPSQPDFSQDQRGPILPGEQSGGMGKILLLVFALTAIAMLIYYVLHR